MRTRLAASRLIVKSFTTRGAMWRTEGRGPESYRIVTSVYPSRKHSLVPSYRRSHYALIPQYFCHCYLSLIMKWSLSRTLPTRQITYVLSTRTIYTEHIYYVVIVTFKKRTRRKPGLRTSPNLNSGGSRWTLNNAPPFPVRSSSNPFRVLQNEPTPTCT